MKKFLVLTMSLLISFSLFACSNDPAPANQNENLDAPKPTSDVYFENDILKIEMATLKLTGAEIAPGDDFCENGYLVIFYEVTNDQEEETLAPSDVFIACFNAQQESNATVDDLEIGITPDTYDDKLFPYSSSLKPGATGSDVMCYELNGTNNPVILYATQGIWGDKLGKKTYNIA